MSNKGPRLLAIALAVAGFVVSGVLEYVHAKTYLAPGSKSFCRVDATMDCGVVALSRLSVLGGVPLPVWGAAGFLALAIAIHRRSPLFLPLAATAAIVSVGLLVESLTHVGTICLLCEGVHVLAIGLLILAVWRRRDVDRTTPMRRQALDVLVTPAAMVLLAMLFAPRYWQPLTWQAGVPYPHGTTESGDPWVGAENPKVTIEEYVDYGCPHCAVASNRIRMRLTRDADELRVVRKHKPRTRCTEAGDGCVALRMALCAEAQDKFWEMDSWLFMHAPGKALVDVEGGARALGLDVPTFMACHAAPQTYARAAGMRKAAGKAHIRETPAYVVEGTRVDVGEIADVIDARL